MQELGARVRAARRAWGDMTDEIASTARRRAGSGGDAAVIAAAAAVAGAAAGGGAPGATCRPWSRADFDARVVTYSAVRWFARPGCVSALACARRGWVCTGPDALGCGGCSAALRLALPGDAAGRGALDAAAAAFAARLETAHAPLCAWRGNACPPGFAALDAAPSPALRGAFVERVGGLRATLAAAAAAAGADGGGVEGEALDAWCGGVDVRGTLEAGGGAGAGARLDALLDALRAAHPGVAEGRLGRLALELAVAGWDAAVAPHAQHSGREGRGAPLRCRVCQREWTVLGGGGSAKRARVASDAASPGAGAGAAAETAGARSAAAAGGATALTAHRWFCPWVCDGGARGLPPTAGVCTVVRAFVRARVNVPPPHVQMRAAAAARGV